MWFRKKIIVITTFRLTFIPGKELQYVVEKNDYKTSRLSKDFLEPVKYGKGKRVIYKDELSTGKVQVNHQMSTSEKVMKEITAESHWEGAFTPDQGSNMYSILRHSIQEYINTYFTIWASAVQVWPKYEKK